jgi:5'-AMP-activated protein kinase regulatory gamma subunit
MRKSLEELNLGTYKNVISAHRSSTIIEAFNSFIDKRISALPVLDDDGTVIDIYAKFDVIHLASDKSYNNLNMTVEDALRKRKKDVGKVATCYKTATLKAVMEQIVQAEFHRLAVVDKENKLVGIISLSDILHFLILKPSIPYNHF